MHRVELRKAVELAPRVWWVGSLLPGDAFQCHVYLIEQGDQSVLIDPGSALNVDEVISKIDAVVGLDNVRWLVCSHADPDIIGALPALVAHGLHPDAQIVTHWRDEALMVHSGTSLPFWRIEDHGWSLPLVDRTLRFVFTPYVHFAGAFCTFDEQSRTLFTSDLFGGFTAEEALYATSVDCFEGMRAFHEHYMPSGEVLAHAVSKLRELGARCIAPQHGQIIPEALVMPIMDRLAQLECGVYLMARDDPGLRFVLTANRTVHDVMETVLAETDFAQVVRHVADLAAEHLGTEHLELWGRTSSRVFRFHDADGFAGTVDEPPIDVVSAFSGQASVPGMRTVLPLRSSSSAHVGGAAVLQFAASHELDNPTRAVVDQVAGLLEVGLEREVLRRAGDLERETLYRQATHDPLTGLLNRAYLTDLVERLCAIDDRSAGSSLAALMIDIDHFKRVNDLHGHPVGDVVLQGVARAISQQTRAGDVAVRFGGEEFLVLLTATDPTHALAVAERIRASIALPAVGAPRVTASVGVALRRRGEPCDPLVARADAALYSAKAEGRDRVDLAG